VIDPKRTSAARYAVMQSTALIQRRDVVGCSRPLKGATIRRREFIALLGGTATSWPLATRAQQTDRVRRIGILTPYPPGDLEMQARVRAFREELRKLGWASGVNAQFDERWTGDNMDLIRAAALNLVELNPDAILADGARVIPILMGLTRSIPIVVPGGTDPVGRGWAESLAHPGGNVTGFAALELSIIGKMLQTLKEIAPNVVRVSMIYNPDNPIAAFFASCFESTAGPLGVEPIVARIHGLADIERAVAAAAARPDGGLFFPLDLTISALVEQTVATVARYRLPAIYSEQIFVTSGGLVYYGTDRVDLYRRCASYVDRILRGEKAGDLPYQQPNKYDLVINLKTAKALDLTVPPSLLASADEVIE
jgi:putative ABC transport system substrate-binding protein